MRGVIIGAVVTAAALACAPPAAQAKWCAYDSPVSWPGVEDLNAKRTSCAKARNVVITISDQLGSGKPFPRTVRDGAGAGGRRWRCAYEFIETRDGGYQQGTCRRGVRRALFRHLTAAPAVARQRGEVVSGSQTTRRQLAMTVATHDGWCS